MPMLNFARAHGPPEINTTALAARRAIDADSSVDFSRGARAGEVNCTQSCLKNVGQNPSFLVFLEYCSRIAPRCGRPF